MRRDCYAYVGCYSGTTNALGRLADADLRKAKMRAHHYLNQLWRDRRHQPSAHIHGYPNNLEFHENWHMLACLISSNVRKMRKYAESD